MRRIFKWAGIALGLVVLLALAGFGLASWKLADAGKRVYVVNDPPLVVDRVYVDGPAVWRHVQAGVRFAMVSFLLIMALDALRANRASGGQLWPEPGHVGRVALVALGFAVFGSGLSAALASRVTRAKTARQILRTGFLLALAATVYGLRHVGADLQYQLMTMVQPGGGWLTLAIVCGALLAAGAVLTRTAQSR